MTRRKEPEYVDVEFNGRIVRVLDLSRSTGHGPKRPKTKKPRRQKTKHLEWGPEPGDFEITKEWIFDNRTEAGGWKADQLMAIGLGFPPSQGWIDRSVGILISDRARADFERRPRWSLG